MRVDEFKFSYYKRYLQAWPESALLSCTSRASYGEQNHDVLVSHMWILVARKQCGRSPSVSSHGLAFSWVGLSVGAGWRTRLNTSLKCSNFSCSFPTTDSNLIGALQSFTLSVHREAAYCCQAETLLHSPTSPKLIKRSGLIISIACNVTLTAG